jgi:hypothetical protein
MFFCKRFFDGLIQGGGLYRAGVGAYSWMIFCVSNKQVSHKQEYNHAY